MNIEKIAEQSGLSISQTESVLAALSDQLTNNLRNEGEYEFLDLFRIKLVKIPAKEARVGVNPFTGEDQHFKAMPATTKLRFIAKAKLKDTLALRS